MGTLLGLVGIGTVQKVAACTATLRRARAMRPTSSHGNEATGTHGWGLFSCQNSARLNATFSAHVPVPHS